MPCITLVVIVYYGKQERHYTADGGRQTSHLVEKQNKYFIGIIR